MDFNEFLTMYNAYKIYKESMTKQTVSNVQTPPAAPITPVQFPAPGYVMSAPLASPAPAGAYPPFAGEVTQTPPSPAVPELEARLSQLEQRVMNPSLDTVEPKGLEDVFNKMLG